MAWNAEKNALLVQLYQERVKVESDSIQYREWGLTRSWMNIFNNNVTNAQKQAMLNDLIDDKVAYYDRLISGFESSQASLSANQTLLLTNKE